MTKKKATGRKTSPINKKKDMENIPDKKINQDFPGFPGSPSGYELINPLTKTEKINANTNIKDGEKRSSEEVDESKSDGSGGAFEGTEEVKE